MFESSLLLCNLSSQSSIKKTFLSIKQTKYFLIVQLFLIEYVFDQNIINHQLFKICCQPLIEHAMQGYNICIFAYGQTSTGKSYTILGSQQNPGLIPLSIHQIFKLLSNNSIGFQVRISYIEIYMEVVYDLINNKKGDLFNNKLIGIQQIVVQTNAQAMDVFYQGQSKRKISKTGMNEKSSRSHTIFKITFQFINSNRKKIISTVNLIDLAGSQSISKTNSSGNVKKQADNINKSLLALSNVMRGLSNKKQYVNFRDSKLTRILQPALNGNCKTSVICTISKQIGYLSETINTLKFGTNCGLIKNSIYINQKPDKTEKQFDQEQYVQEIRKVKFQLQLKKKDNEFYLQRVEKYKGQAEYSKILIRNLQKKLLQSQQEINHLKSVIQINQQRRNQVTQVLKEYKKLQEQNQKRLVNEQNSTLKLRKQSDRIQEMSQKIIILEKQNQENMDKISKLEKQLVNNFRKMQKPTYSKMIVQNESKKFILRSPLNSIHNSNSQKEQKIKMSSSQKLQQLSLLIQKQKQIFNLRKQLSRQFKRNQQLQQKLYQKKLQQCIQKKCLNKPLCKCKINHNELVRCYNKIKQLYQYIDQINRIYKNK